MKGPGRISPPKLADRFFKWYCCEDLKETIQGDLHERFFDDLEKKRPFKAKINYWKNVFRFINRHTLTRKKSPRNYQSNNSAMFKNYLLVTIRSLWKNKAFASINIFGLAIGLASCLIIFFYVSKELSFDKFHSKNDRIFRVTNTFERASGSIYWARTPPALAPAIRSNFPGIEKVTRLRYADDRTYSVGDKVFVQGNVFFADSLFLEIFDFPLKSGNPNNALDEPGSILITEEMANKYFGQEEPLGQLITYENDRTLKVTGVLEPLPSNSHISFDMLISFSSFEIGRGNLANLNSWGWAGFHTYIQTSEKADLSSLKYNIQKLYMENLNRANIEVDIEVQPLVSIYLKSNKYTNVGESIRTGNEPTIYGLSVISILILFVAGFNFMNLSTAISLNRGKEIGIRKVMGAVKGKIAIQFLTESVIVGLISLIIAFGLILLSEPYFKAQLDVELPNRLLDYAGLIPLFVLSTVIIGVLAGSYPSIVLSSFNPIAALKGNLKTGKSGTILRNGLMVFQFTISVILIAATIIIYYQMNFIRDKSLGFDRENVLKLRISERDMNNHYPALKNRYELHSQIRNVSRSNHAFDGSASQGPARLKGSNEDEAYQLAYYQADYDFAKVTGIKLLEGRFFSKEFPNDTSEALILNKSAVDMIGLSEPLGQRIQFNSREKVVIGVVEDFHFASLHSTIAPMGLVMPFTNIEVILIKTTPGNIAETLSTLEEEWKQVVGPAPFDVTFLDDGIQNMYEREQKLASLINVFSILAVILACLGLYGLVAFSVQSKLKEVGIRKVLGASIGKLLLVLSKQFIILILLANVVAVPLINYLGNMWLGNFAYRIDLQWWMYLSAGLILLLIAMFTISHQTIKAALTNPVNVLRNE